MDAILWILAAFTFVANLPSIFLYALPGMRESGADRRRGAAFLFVVARSAALATTVVVAVTAHYLGWGNGWLLGVGVATALTQAMDVPSALYAGDRRAAAGAAVLCLVQTAAIVAACVWAS